MKRTPWYRHWFGDEYLALYPHRDRAEARRAVALLRDATGLGPGTRVLDLGCGAGRHLEEMERIGYRATGLDLSRPLIEAARRSVPRVHLVRGDMRQPPFRTDSFDVVTSYFTSFGYFDDEDEDLDVLREVRRVLRAGGRFLLDFLNADHVVANLKTEDRRMASGTDVVQERRLVNGGRIVEKRITLTSTDGSSRREFVERVRLYRPRELTSMLRSSGLVPGPSFGGYDRTPFSGTATRYILVARAAG